METERFVLRELTESDASEQYLAWFRDAQASTYIAAAATTVHLDDLRRFIRERSGRPDVLFLGIFDKASGTHIGNIKYEPVNVEQGYAVMGLLIGEAAYRGKGVAVEVLAASGEWLKRCRGISEIALGVHRSNAGAIRAYEKVGYREASTPLVHFTGTDSMTMVWSL